MVVVPVGSFRMGCLSNSDEKPVREVTISEPFAGWTHEGSFHDYDHFRSTPRSRARGEGRKYGSVQLGG